ncbi:hypothetical protein Tcan_12144 [Toxocara canis]|uniref:Uncharacterized protein n=1 Tax=Toxocara canis TaxID=6265 RepID=A0A0B2UTU9_TOXCA|nr:hypothetical protein Tcan_12144 [Toxocara canis]
MPVEKSAVAMKGTTPGKERNILYSTFKERDEGVRKGTSCKTTIAAVFVTLLGLALLLTAGGQLTCDSRGVMDEEVLLIGNEDIEEPDDENKKLQFVYDKLNHELRKKVEQNWMKICRHDDILITTIRWISERDPVEAARQLFGREDIQNAAKIGDAFGIRCSDQKPEELTLEEQRGRDEDFVFNASLVSSRCNDKKDEPSSESTNVDEERAPIMDDRASFEPNRSGRAYDRINEVIEVQEPRQDMVSVATEQYIRAEAIQCMKSVRQIRTYNILRIGMEQSSDTSSIQAIRHDECWQLWKAKELDEITVRSVAKDIWMSTEDAKSFYEWLEE